MNSLRRLLQNERGLSLVELSIALILAAIAAGVTFTVFTSTQGSYYQTREISDAQADLRIVSGMITTELRAVGSNPWGDAGISFEPIAAADSTTIQFRADLNGDGAIDGFNEPCEEITYTWGPGAQELYRVTWAGSFVVMTGVEDFQIRYFDVDGNAMSSPLDANQRRNVRSLQINLSVRGDDGVLRAWTTTAGFRNDLQS